MSSNYWYSTYQRWLKWMTCFKNNFYFEGNVALYLEKNGNNTWSEQRGALLERSYMIKQFSMQSSCVHIPLCFLVRKRIWLIIYIFYQKLGVFNSLFMPVWCVCVCLPHVQRSEVNFEASFLSFHHVDPRIQTGVLTLGGICPFLLSHLAGKISSSGFFFSWLVVLCFVYSAKDQTQSQASAILVGQPASTFGTFLIWL